MPNEQQGFLTKAQRSLEAAKILKEEGFNEFAVSRAYYAMFYVASALLEREGLSFSKHSAVISALGEQFAKRNRIPRDYHRYLIDAQAQRNRGDYNIDPNISESDTQLLISRAEIFIDFVIKNIDSI
ncbi:MULTISPECIES: HEPN domain-containing protein [unclassified Crocosphaera]|uniref:HEPN domain-containing protein n=1 Tax=unclassified Crocosphaera TaxID=2623705 RepID=UPI00257CD809|nr:HEPN domain-containing protein [Crocosphaera sp.]NQZ65580.1 HEPN domain-containing protein [Crocosphaera sp.]